MGSQGLLWVNSINRNSCHYLAQFYLTPFYLTVSPLKNMSDLFSNTRPAKEEIYPDVFVLANFVNTGSLLEPIEKIVNTSPFRKMMTPMGYYTNIALTNCGKFGWTSDNNGYRYSQIDPLNNQAWPNMPDSFRKLAKEAAQIAGYENFEPDACLINQYIIGSKLGSHQDKNEKNFSQPIVSVSIGLTAIFQIFGQQRGGTPINYQLQDGDIMVWGKSARLVYHGVKALTADKLDPNVTQRFNITFRKAE